MREADRPVGHGRWVWGQGATGKPANPHCPEMDANENSGYWFHTKPLPEMKEGVLAKLLAWSLTS